MVCLFFFFFFPSCRRAALLWGRTCRGWPATSNGPRSFVVASCPTGAASASWLTCTHGHETQTCFFNKTPDDLGGIVAVPEKTSVSSVWVSWFFPVRPLGRAEPDDVLHRCERLLESLDQLDERLFSEWTVGLEEVCRSHLKEPLLTLDPDTGHFHVNFSAEVGSESQI